MVLAAACGASPRDRAQPYVELREPDRDARHRSRSRSLPRRHCRPADFCLAWYGTRLIARIDGAPRSNSTAARWTTGRQRQVGRYTVSFLGFVWDPARSRSSWRAREVIGGGAPRRAARMSGRRLKWRRRPPEDRGPVIVVFIGTAFAHRCRGARGPRRARLRRSPDGPFRAELMLQPGQVTAVALDAPARRLRAGRVRFTLPGRRAVHPVGRRAGRLPRRRSTAALPPTSACGRAAAPPETT